MFLNFLTNCIFFVSGIWGDSLEKKGIRASEQKVDPKIGTQDKVDTHVLAILEYKNIFGITSFFFHKILFPIVLGKLGYHF